MGLLRRLDVIVLALMLAGVIAIVGHAAYRYHSIRRSPATDTNRREIFAADLRLRLYTLRSIANTAPFFGLAGSCIGILDSFTGIGMQRWAALALLSSNLSRAPITTAAALLVTVPAIWSHNYLGTLLDLLKIKIPGSAHETIRQQKRSVGVAQSLPLKKQFSGLPSSAVTVAPCLALVIAGFITFSSFGISMGLPVGLLRTGGRTAREEYFTTDPVVIVVAMSGNGSPVIYVNSKKTPLDELGNTVRGELDLRPRRVAYVEAESGVRWTDVANVIDIVELDATVVVSTITPDMKSSPGGRQLGKGH
ncbi:MAG: MotA/TolQ/ExbB proton channel family protein [Candidatus Sulfotelmatobacter sp.]